MKLRPLPLLIATLLLLTMVTGCALFPEHRQRDRIHNPFPQLKRVAVLPFFNQSNEPTLDTEVVTQKYYAALQAIPGFEVMPVGVTKSQWIQHVLAHGEPRTGEDFQELAKTLGVEALVVGSVTDFDSYYPPRLAMTVHWYAANQGFHPIPTGYGLPWGTEHEKHIPRRITRDAEFELARSQLVTQTPVSPATMPVSNPPLAPSRSATGLSQTSDTVPVPVPNEIPYPSEMPLPGEMSGPGETSVADDTSLAGPIGVSLSDIDAAGTQFHDDAWLADAMEPTLPEDWPDPTDLIPDPPSPHRPLAVINRDPVLSHTRIYRGDDPYFTNRLADHVETGDDARPGGWQGYLKRSDDFIHFCCHLHITEMLESRGGSDQRDLILRWPLSRY